MEEVYVIDPKQYTCHRKLRQRYIFHSYIAAFQ